MRPARAARLEGARSGRGRRKALGVAERAAGGGGRGAVAGARGAAGRGQARARILALMTRALRDLAIAR